MPSIIITEPSTDNRAMPEYIRGKFDLTGYQIKKNTNPPIFVTIIDESRRVGGPERDMSSLKVADGNFDGTYWKIRTADLDARLGSHYTIVAILVLDDNSYVNARYYITRS